MIKVLQIKNAKILACDFDSRNHYGPHIEVRIDGRKANKMLKEGWSVKSKEINGNKVWFIPVAVYSRLDHANLKPDVHIKIGKHAFSNMNQEEMKILDFATITKCTDLEIYGYEWSINHPRKISGIKAYLKEGTFELNGTVDTLKLLSYVSRRS